ncbi:hypothetical protein Droror1_Dr00028316 [Drosera rotundifolia]
MDNGKLMGFATAPPSPSSFLTISSFLSPTTTNHRRRKIAPTPLVALVLVFPVHRRVSPLLLLLLPPSSPILPLHHHLQSPPPQNRHRTPRRPHPCLPCSSTSFVVAPPSPSSPPPPPEQIKANPEQIEANRNLPKQIEANPERNLKDESKSCRSIDVLVVAGEGFCAAAPESTEQPLYWKVNHPTLSPSHLSDLPGFTRTVYKSDHALIAPESHVFSPLPEWKNALGAYLLTPAMGSHLVMYLAKMQGVEKLRGFCI